MEHAASTWIGWVMAVALLLPVVRSWLQTYRFFGGITIGQIRQTLYLARYTRHLYVVIAAPIALCSIVLVVLSGVSIPSGIMAVMIAIVLVPVLRLALPPAVLFLAGSGDRASSLFFRIHVAVGPLRVVALLDPHRMGFIGHVLRFDLMRTSSEKTWKSMVHRLIDIAPVIVADTVHRTGPVRYEAFLMLSPERAGRTIFVGNDEGMCPSLQAEGIDPSEHAIPITPVDEIETATIQFLRVVDTRRMGRVARAKDRLPVVREDWNSLPSMLTIGLTEGLVGEYVLAQAHKTDKDLIALLVPLSSIDEDVARLIMELSWDFSFNPRLVGLYLEMSSLAIVRRDFLRANPDLLDMHVPSVSREKMSFDALNKADPVAAAVSELCLGWAAAAERRGLEFRFVRK